MSERAKFIKGVGLVGIAKFATNLRGLILLPILAKTLGAAGYGIWSQVLVTIGFLVPFATLNLSLSMIRFLAAEKIKENTAKGIFTVIFSTLLLGAAFALALFLFSGPFATLLLKDPSASLFIKIAGALLVLEALNQTCLEPFKIFGHIKTYSLLTVLQPILEIALVSYLVFSGQGLLGALIAFCVVRTIILLFSLYFIIAHAGFSLPDFSILGPYLAFGLPFIPVGLLDTFISSSDRYVLGFFKGAATVGIYSAAYNIGLVAGAFAFPIASILSPTIFKLFDQNEIGKVKSYLTYSLKYFLLFAIPSAFGLTVLAKSLLSTLATTEFSSLTTMFVVLLVSVSAVFYGIQIVFGEVLMMFKNTKFFIIAFGLGAVLNFALNMILVPYFGIIAAATTTLVAYGLVTLIIYWKSSKYMKFDINFLFVAKSIAAAFGMAIVVYLLHPIGMVKILLSVGVGVIIYFCILFLLRGFEKTELETIGHILKLGKKR